jgi:hypothetical protein
MSKKAKLSYDLYRQQRGELNALLTTEQSNLVGAINEVKGLIGDDHFKGEYTSFAALEAAVTEASAGDYAYVDGGEGSNVETYIWDTTDEIWILVKGGSTAETASSIKTKYESNTDTNAYTDAEKTKLSGISSGATKTEASAVNGQVKIDGVETVVFEETEIEESAYNALSASQKELYEYIVIPDSE